MSKDKRRRINLAKRLLSFIVICLEVIALDSPTIVHLLDDKLRIAPNVEFVATDGVSNHVVKSVDQTFVFGLVVGDVIPQVITFAGDGLFKKMTLNAPKSGLENDLL